jgi:arsenate reductase
MGDLAKLFQDEIEKKHENSKGINSSSDDTRKKVLFVCTGNSVRSQMAEALLRTYGGDKFEVFSAGTTPAGIHALTKHVLAEMNVTTEGQYSKHIDEFADINFDYVIPLCEVAALSCVNITGDHERINWYIDDPIRVLGDDERKLMAFRITRNILKQKVLKFIEENGK